MFLHIIHGDLIGVSKSLWILQWFKCNLCCWQHSLNSVTAILCGFRSVHLDFETWKFIHRWSQVSFPWMQTIQWAGSGAQHVVVSWQPAGMQTLAIPLHIAGLQMLVLPRQLTHPVMVGIQLYMCGPQVVQQVVVCSFLHFRFWMINEPLLQYLADKEQEYFKHLHRLDTAHYSILCKYAAATLKACTNRVYFCDLSHLHLLHNHRNST